MSFQDWHEEFDRFWPEHSKISKICTLMGSFWLKYIMLEVKYYRGVIFDGTEDWSKIWRKTDLCFLKWQIHRLVHRLKNSCFILGTKMAELNQNKNRPDRPDAVWKLFLPWKYINSTINKTFCTSSTESLFSRYKQISKKAVKLGSFFEC